MASVQDQIKAEIAAAEAAGWMMNGYPVKVRAGKLRYDVNKIGADMGMTQAEIDKARSLKVPKMTVEKPASGSWDIPGATDKYQAQATSHKNATAKIKQLGEKGVFINNLSQMDAGVKVDFTSEAARTNMQIAGFMSNLRGPGGRYDLNDRITHTNREGWADFVGTKLIPLAGLALASWVVAPAIASALGGGSSAAGAGAAGAASGSTGAAGGIGGATTYPATGLGAYGAGATGAAGGIGGATTYSATGLGPYGAGATGALGAGADVAGLGGISEASLAGVGAGIGEMSGGMTTAGLGAAGVGALGPIYSGSASGGRGSAVGDAATGAAGAIGDAATGAAGAIGDAATGAIGGVGSVIGDALSGGIPWDGILSAAGALAGGALAYFGADKAADAQEDAAKAAAEVQWKMYEQSRADLAPWREAGAGAVEQLSEKVAAGPGQFTESPGYQFTLDQGLDAGRNALSAMGKNRSGSAIKAATEYAEGLASTEYDNFLKRWYQSLTPYQSLAGLGQTSAGQTANLGAAAGSNVGNAYMAGGQANAAGTINQTNALTGAITGGVNNLLYSNSLRNLQQPQYTPYPAGTPNYTGRPVDQWQYGYS